MQSFMLTLAGGRKIGVEGNTIHEAARNAGLSQDMLREMGFVSFAKLQELPLVVAEQVPPCTY